FYRSGYSTIIRESRDFSCVILDRNGRLLVAPPMFFHAPVYRHLVGRILEVYGAASSPSPRLRGEGRDEGAFPQDQTRGQRPSPGAQECADLSPQAGRGEAAVSKAISSPACWEGQGGEIRDGDVFVSNHPYEGELPHVSDMAFVAPVFDGGKIVAFAGSIAHK